MLGSARSARGRRSATWSSMLSPPWLSFPARSSRLAGGALFGPFWGSLWNLLGATLGATLAFLVARYVGGDWVERKAGGLLKRLIDGVDAEGWRFVAFVRLVPLFPFNLSNYVLGLTRIPLHQYVIATSRLHGARHGRLHVARARRTRGADRRSGYGALRPARARSARGDRLAAATDRADARVIRMDRGKRTQAPARQRRSRDRHRRARTRRVHRTARPYRDRAQYSCCRA